jgi:hypothetical protein
MHAPSLRVVRRNVARNGIDFTLAECPDAHPSNEQLATFDYVFDYRDGKLAPVKP